MAFSESGNDSSVLSPVADAIYNTFNNQYLWRWFTDVDGFKQSINLISDLETKNMADLLPDQTKPEKTAILYRAIILINNLLEDIPYNNNLLQAKALLKQYLRFVIKLPSGGKKRTKHIKSKKFNRTKKYKMSKIRGILKQKSKKRR
jgi:hypothetical protein